MDSPSSTEPDDESIIKDEKIIFTDLEYEVAKLRINGKNSQLSSPKAKIQKFQPYPGAHQEFARYYSPKLVSIGPIHHERGKNYKLMWAAMYLEVQGKGTREAFEELLIKIIEKMDLLKECYSYDVIKEFNDNELAQIFLLDGCAVLHFMEKASVEHPEELKIKVDQLVIVHHDLLLLENQLPYQLLKLLCIDGEDKLEHYINNFFNMNHMMPPNSGKLTIRNSEEAITRVDHPTHLLDFLRTAILKGKTQGVGQTISKESDQDWPTYRNIKELKSAWIKVGVNKQESSLTNIIFTRRRFYRRGKLQLSKFVVNDFTVTTILNLIAYEMCPDFDNHYEIVSYIAFLASLINRPDDVKVLRKAGVLYNALGRDEEVAKLFNTIAAKLVPNPYIYANVRRQIAEHYRNKFFICIAEGSTKNVTWTILGVLVAFLALVPAFMEFFPSK